MFTLIVFVLLFNITYTINTDKLFPQPLGSIGLEHKLETNSQNTKLTKSSPDVDTVVVPPQNEHAVNRDAAQLNKNSEDIQHAQEQLLNQQNKVSNGNHDLKPISEKETKNINDHDVIANGKTSDASKESKPNIVKEDKSSTVQSQAIPKHLNEDVQSGALLRGFYVFVGLSVLIMMYLIFRSYRLRHGSQPSATVRKYGVTARRSDMEMRPLELEEEDDDTLFEINNRNVVR